MPRALPGDRHHGTGGRFVDSDRALCGARRAPGVKIVKNRKQTTCPRCCELYDAQVKLQLPVLKGPLAFTR